jgi:hypothetical protein
MIPTRSMSCGTFFEAAQFIVSCAFFGRGVAQQHMARVSGWPAAGIRSIPRGTVQTAIG